MKWGSTRGPYDDVHTYVAMTWFNSTGEGWGLLLISAEQYVPNITWTSSDQWRDSYNDYGKGKFSVFFNVCGNLSLYVL